MITDIRDGKRPFRPTDPSQNQWLQDRIWDTITTCWNDEPERRCELSVVHHILSTPSPWDTLAEFPPVSHKNLIVLAEELLYMFLILPLDPGERAMLRKMQRYISDAISRDGPSTSSSAEVGETFHEVSFPPLIFFSVTDISRDQATEILSSHLRPSSFHLWLRLYTHALLLELRIFAGIELSDEALGYMPTGFTDIWKGNFNGELVCIKAIRKQDPIRLREIKSVCGPLISSETYSAFFTPDLPS